MFKEKVVFQTSNPKVVQQAIKPELDFDSVKIKITTLKDKITFEVTGNEQSSVTGAKKTIERYFKAANSALNI